MSDDGSLRNEMEFSVGDGVEPQEIVSVFEDNGFDVVHHRTYKDRQALAKVRSYSISRSGSDE